MTDDYPDWYTHALPHFEKYLLPMAGKNFLQFLQIGAFTGDITVWLCDNVLTGMDAVLVDVDTWRGSADEQAHQELDWRAVRRRYVERIEEPHRRPVVTAFSGTSDQFFATNSSRRWDFVYIDGSHLARDVLRDAVSADQWLKPGGIMAFDDYAWHTDWPPHMIPRTAIESFMHTRESAYEVLASDYQFWIRKVSQ